MAKVEGIPVSHEQNRDLSATGIIFFFNKNHKKSLKEQKEQSSRHIYPPNDDQVTNLLVGVKDIVTEPPEFPLYY